MVDAIQLLPYLATMDSKKVVELVELIQVDPTAVRSVGKNLGVSLGQGGSIAAADAYASAIRPTESDASEAFVHGYLTCARDVANGYVLGLNELAAKDPVRLAQAVESKSGAVEIMRLADKRKVIRLADVNELLGDGQEAQWSRLLKELRAQRLLEPLLGGNGRERPQALTLLGRKVIEVLDAPQKASRSATLSEQAGPTCAQKLASSPSSWNENGFKEAFKSGGKVVRMFAEALRCVPGEKVDDFCRALYTSNLYWCAESLLLVGLENMPSRVSRELEVAVLCSVADRVRDPFQVTVEQAREALSVNPLGERLASMTRDELELFAGDPALSAPWFETWRAWFTKASGWGVNEADISMIEDQDPVQAWTAANAIKRGARFSSPVTRKLIAALQHGERDVRWRAVHVLGAFPSKEACAAFKQYAHDDSFHWVARSATRSLLEMLLRSDEKEERDAIDDALKVLVLPSPNGGGHHAQPLIELSRSVAISRGARAARKTASSAYFSVAGATLAEAKSLAVVN